MYLAWVDFFANSVTYQKVLTKIVGELGTAVFESNTIFYMPMNSMRFFEGLSQDGIAIDNEYLYT